MSNPPQTTQSQHSPHLDSQSHPNPSQPHQSSGSSPTPSQGNVHPHVAHHVAEFGPVLDLVHIAGEKRDSDSLPAPDISRKDRLSRRERWTRLRKRLLVRRHLMQYFHQDTLYRTEGSRRIGPDELFLDLVIVGGIAALGHELRETFTGWSEVEKFFLLFAAIYSGWRALVMLWNLWDVRSDLVDKAGIYVVFFCLTGVALGAHGAFDNGPRPYVAVSAFLATALPAAQSLYWSWQEPLLKNPQNIINQVTLSSVLSIVSVVPYFAAAFVGERAARNLFWVPIVAQMIALYFTASFYRLLHRNRTGYSRLAIAIELMVEKYEVLTMIVLGESVIGLLFESALVITADGVRIGHLYAAAAAATAMLYALQTLYANVDGRIVKGGVHAIRHKGLFGIFWSQLHMFYHLALVMFATGLGIAIRDIAIPPQAEAATERMVAVLVRASGSVNESSGVARFNRDERWLFSAGWGASILLSGLIGSLHLAGPRIATKWYRLGVRAALTVGVMVGMPFTNASADNYVLVHTLVLLFIALGEFVCHNMDGMGFFRSELSTLSNSSNREPFGESMDDEDTEDSNAATEEVVKVCRRAAGPCIARELEARLRKRHCNTLVPVDTASPTQKKAESQTGEIQA